MTSIDDDLAKLQTERQNDAHHDLDTWSVHEIATAMNALDREVADAVATQLDQITAATELIISSQRAGGRLIYVGAGSAGRLGVLDAAECGPTFGVSPGQVLALVAGGFGAVTSAVEAAEDNYEAGYDAIMGIGVGHDDVVVGVSASGRTPYVLGAFTAAHRQDAATVAVVNNPDTAIANAAGLAIEAVTGPELITGSTRLKAGTAQKMVLNMLSSISMIKLGHTYGNLMVDVRVSNEKLRSRAASIVRDITGATTEQALEALNASGDKAKVAAIMLSAGIDAHHANERLECYAGNLRAALAQGES